jgi:uncharacterized membrane-anchored protein YhcB (DUF1043 family)
MARDMDALWNEAVWRAMLVPFVGGLALGALVAYLALRRDHVRRRELQREVERLEGELSAYRAQVHQHFRRTSDLFQALTASYRAFYEHLASGASSLCREERLAPALDLPEARLLSAGQVAAGATGPSEGVGVDAAPAATGPGAAGGPAMDRGDGPDGPPR